MTKLKKRLDVLVDKELKILESDTSTPKEKEDAISRIAAMYSMNSDATKHDNWLAYVKLGIELLSVIGPLVFYGIWMRRGLKFEETGTITSSIFKGLIGKFKPTK